MLCLECGERRGLSGFWGLPDHGEEWELFPQGPWVPLGSLKQEVSCSDSPFRKITLVTLSTVDCGEAGVETGKSFRRLLE